MAYTFAQLVQYAEQGGFPAAVAPTAAAIALAESSGNNVIQKGQPYATTGYGLWQITPGNSEPQFGTDNALLDPVANARAAFAKYKGSGNSFRPWTTFNDGKYRQYMNGAAAAPASAPAGAAGDPLSGVTGAIDGISAPFAKLAGSLSVFDKLSMPQFWVRVGAGFFGAGLVGFGVVMLTREVRN